MRGRVLGCVVAALTISCAIGATTAYGVTFTSSNITQPASGTTTFTTLNNAGGTMTVSGTTSGGTGNVDIVCYSGSHPTWYTDVSVAASNVTVTGSNPGTFSTTLDTANNVNNVIPYGACTLRAVPHVVPFTSPADPSLFTGPQLILNHHDSYTLTSGPNSGALYDYFFSNQESQAYDDFESVSSCGLCDSRLFIDPANFYNSAYLFYGNAAMYQNERLSSNDRGYAQIDGHNVLFSWGAHAVNPSGSPFPTLTMSSSFAPNGDMTIVEDEDAIRCPTDVLPYGSGTGKNPCPSFLPTGVHLHRTILQTAGGTVNQIVDVWSSTDHASHSVNFDYDQNFNDIPGGTTPPPPPYEPSFQFPWVSSGYAVHNQGDMIPGPAAAPVSLFVKANSTAADGDTYYPQGAITVNPAPNGFGFYSTNHPNSDFVMNYQRQIPAGGNLTIKQTFSMGTTQAGVAALAAQAADQQDVPVVAISAPANGSTVSTPTVPVTGTATDSGISSLTVNGKAVALGAGGAFSTPVNLTAGANTITATATDGAGNQGSASVKVTYQPPPKLMLVGSPVASSTGVAFSINCQAAAGAVCAGGATMTSLEKLLGKQITGVVARKNKRSSRRVVVGSMSFSLTAGKTQKLFVPLNSTGRKLLARLKRLPVTLTIKLSANSSSVLTIKTTLKPKKKKQKKH